MCELMSKILKFSKVRSTQCLRVGVELEVRSETEIFCKQRFERCTDGLMLFQGRLYAFCNLMELIL